MVNYNYIWIPLWILGALIIVIGTFLNWMEITITFSDGTREIISASGFDLYSEYRGKGMPIDSSAPIIYLLIALGIVVLAAVQLKDAKEPSSSLVITMLLIFGVMVISGSMAVDSISYATTSSGMEAHGIPEWLSDIAGKDVSSATVGRSNGYLISIIGVLISFFATLVCIKGVKSSLQDTTP